MRRTEVLQGIRLMKFEENLDRARTRDLRQGEAASVLGVSEGTFRRWRERYDAGGAEVHYDRRLGKVSARRVPVDTVIDLFDTRYFDFTALLIEHNMRVIIGVCERIHVLDGGRTIARGTPREVQNDPAVITAYLGSG